MSGTDTPASDNTTTELLVLMNVSIVYALESAQNLNIKEDKILNAELSSTHHSGLRMLY